MFDMQFALSISLVTLVVLTAATPQPLTQKPRGISIPLSKRFSLVNEDKTVNVEALRSHVANTRNKVLRGFENIERNAGVQHPLVLNEVQMQDTGSVPLTDCNDTLWYGSISVGTPPSTFTVDFDTGSGNFFLPGPNCDTNCEGHAIYDPSSSSTSSDLDKDYKIVYGDGSTVEAREYSDDVTIAGLTATNQSLGVATSYPSILSASRFPPDGLLGMGFHQASTSGQSTLFENLVSQGVVSNSVFSFKLAQSGAELYLGGTNTSLYTGDISYANVTKEGFWQVDMDNVETDDWTFGHDVASVIITSASLIVAPALHVEYLVSTLGGQDATSSVGYGFYTFPCYRFPSVNLTFGGTSFPILESALNLGTVSSGSLDCVFGIVGHRDISLWAIGDVFLRGVYSVFDMGNARVGFATLA